MQTLDEYRTFLFFEHRRWRHQEGIEFRGKYYDGHPDRAAMKRIRQAVEAIRELLEVRATGKTRRKALARGR